MAEPNYNLTPKSSDSAAMNQLADQVAKMDAENERLATQQGQPAAPSGYTQEDPKEAARKYIAEKTGLVSPTVAPYNPNAQAKPGTEENEKVHDGRAGAGSRGVQKPGQPVDASQLVDNAIDHAGGRAQNSVPDAAMQATGETAVNAPRGKSKDQERENVNRRRQRQRQRRWQRTQGIGNLSRRFHRKYQQKGRTRADVEDQKFAQLQTQRDRRSLPDMKSREAVRAVLRKEVVPGYQKLAQQRQAEIDRLENLKMSVQKNQLTLKMQKKVLEAVNLQERDFGDAKQMQQYVTKENAVALMTAKQKLLAQQQQQLSKRQLEATQLMTLASQSVESRDRETAIDAWQQLTTQLSQGYGYVKDNAPSPEEIYLQKQNATLKARREAAQKRLTTMQAEGKDATMQDFMQARVEVNLAKMGLALNGQQRLAWQQMQDRVKDVLVKAYLMPKVPNQPASEANSEVKTDATKQTVSSNSGQGSDKSIDRHDPNYRMAQAIGHLTGVLARRQTAQQNAQAGLKPALQMLDRHQAQKTPLTGAELQQMAQLLGIRDVKQLPSHQPSVLKVGLNKKAHLLTIQVQQTSKNLRDLKRVQAAYLKAAKDHQSASANQAKRLYEERLLQYQNRRRVREDDRLASQNVLDHLQKKQQSQGRLSQADSKWLLESRMARDANVNQLALDHYDQRELQIAQSNVNVQPTVKVNANDRANAGLDDPHVDAHNVEKAVNVDANQERAGQDSKQTQTSTSDLDRAAELAKGVSDVTTAKLMKQLVDQMKLMQQQNQAMQKQLQEMQHQLDAAKQDASRSTPSFKERFAKNHEQYADKGTKSLVMEVAYRFGHGLAAMGRGLKDYVNNSMNDKNAQIKRAERRAKMTQHAKNMGRSAVNTAAASSQESWEATKKQLAKGRDSLNRAVVGSIDKGMDPQAAQKVAQDMER